MSDPNYIDLHAELPVNWPFKDLYDSLISGETITNGPQNLAYNPDFDRGYLSCIFGCCDTEFSGWLGVCRFLNGDWDAWHVIKSQTPQPL